MGLSYLTIDFRTDSFGKNIESPSQLKQLNQDLQSINHLANQKKHREALPLLISVDYEGGEVNRLGSQYGFPQTFSAAEIGKMGVEKASQEADKMAKTSGLGY